jgi:hypothetical protein
MLCLTCGREIEVLTANSASRGFFCLVCGDNSRQWQSVEPARASTGQELTAAVQPSDDFARRPGDRASGPNAWLRSLERAQLRCAALMEAAARDRAARAAQRECTAAVRRDDKPPIQVSVPGPLTLKPERPEEGNRFDALWNNLAGGIPSSLGVLSLSDEPRMRETLARSESEGVSAFASQIQISEPTQEPISSPLSPSTERIAEIEAAMSADATSFIANEGAEAPQEPTSALLGSPPSVGELEQTNNLKPVPPPELAQVLPMGSQTDDGDLQAPSQAPTAEADQPAPGGSTSLSAEAPRSSILRAMVGLLRTGLRGFEGNGARH